MNHSAPWHDLRYLPQNEQRNGPSFWWVVEISFRRDKNKSLHTGSNKGDLFRTSPPNTKIPHDSPFPPMHYLVYPWFTTGSRWFLNFGGQFPNRKPKRGNHGQSYWYTRFFDRRFVKTETLHVKTNQLQTSILVFSRTVNIQWVVYTIVIIVTGPLNWLRYMWYTAKAYPTLSPLCNVQPQRGIWQPRE